MKISNFVDGLQILRSYYTGEDGYVIGAEHDVFFAHATDKPLPEVAVNRLNELGWFQPDVPATVNGDWKPENYDPEEGWAAFT